jgi:hypothetical protein
MSKFQRSWALFKCSLRVLRENPKLLLFPIVVSILTCVIALFFIAPLAFWNTGHTFLEAEHWKIVGNHLGSWSERTGGAHPNMLGLAALAAVYMVSVFLATFFNVAFYNEILHALNGQSVSVRGGFRFALTRLRAIVMWSLFTGLVGLAIKSLEERVGWLGRWIVRLVGIAWSVACVFVVPAIVRQENHANPLRFLKSSAAVLRKAWGESLIGYVGLQFGGWLALGISVVFLGLAIFLSVVLQTIWVVVIAGVVWLAGLIVFVYLLGVAGQVYRCALYIYATEGVVPEPFETDQMELAWKVKAARKAR